MDLGATTDMRLIWSILSDLMPKASRHSLGISLSAASAGIPAGPAEHPDAALLELAAMLAAAERHCQVLSEMAENLRDHSADPLPPPEAAGLGAIDRESDQESAFEIRLAERIVVLPARTAEGVCAKVRAAAVLEGHDLAAFEAGRLSGMLADTNRSRAATADMVSLSAIIDAAKIIGGTSARSHDRNAA